MNILLVNLAVADILILLVCLPTTVVNDVTKTFWFGEAACKGIIALQVSSEGGLRGERVSRERDYSNVANSLLLPLSINAKALLPSSLERQNKMEGERLNREDFLSSEEHILQLDTVRKHGNI